MLFYCKTQKLKKAVLKIERVVSKQTTLPILGNILIKAKDGRLLLSATNLEIAVQVFITAKIEKEGEFTIPGRILAGFLGVINDEKITIELKKEELLVKSKKHNIKIKGLDAKDFPIIPQKNKDNFFEIKTENLNRAINGLLISVAHNDTRQELNGIFIEFNKNNLTMASTDSFRLTEVILPIENKNEELYEEFKEKNKAIIIPANLLLELQKIDEEERVGFLIEQNQLFISTENILIVSRIINGNYPEYSQILPKKYEIKTTISKDKLIKAIQISSLVVNNQNGEIKINSIKDKKEIIISAQSIDSGENISKITAEINGPDFEVIFNYRYLLEGLNSSLFDDERIVISLNQQKSPVRFSLENKKEINNNKKIKFIYVIMPIIKK